MSKVKRELVFLAFLGFILSPSFVFASIIGDNDMTFDKAGWYLLGWNKSEPFSVDVVEDCSIIISIWKWESNKWSVYLPCQDTSAYTTSKGFNVLSTVSSGDGFWVNVANAGSVSFTSNGGGGNGGDAVVVFLETADAETEESMNQLVQALTGECDLQILDQFVQSIDDMILAEWQESVSAATTLTDISEALNALTAEGLLKGVLQKKVQSEFLTAESWKLYSVLYDGLNSTNSKYQAGAVAFADILKSLQDNNNTDGLGAFSDFLDNLSTSELSATQTLTNGIAQNPEQYIEALLSALHPGYTVVVTSTDLGGGCYIVATQLIE